MSTTKLAIPSTRHLRDLLEQHHAAIAEAMPTKAQVGRLIATIVEAAQRNPGLMECTPESVLTAATKCALLDLRPGPQGEVYLIPRKNKNNYNATELCVDIGYRGYIKAGKRHPDVAYIDGRLVYKGQDFHWDPGAMELRHSYSMEDDLPDEDIIGGYGVAYLKGFDKPVVAPLTRKQIEKRRQCSQSPNGNFWTNHYAMMARKTCIRHLMSLGSVPMSTELAEHIHDEIREEAVTAREEERARPVVGVVTNALAAPDEEPLPDGPEGDNFGLGDLDNEQPDTEELERKLFAWSEAKGLSDNEFTDFITKASKRKAAVLNLGDLDRDELAACLKAAGVE